MLREERVKRGVPMIIPDVPGGEEPLSPVNMAQMSVTGWRMCECPSSLGCWAAGGAATWGAIS